MQRTKWAIGFVMMVLGLLITTQFRVTQQKAIDPGKARAEELSVALKASEAERAKLAAELDRLKAEKGTSAPAAPPRDTSSQALLAGTAEITGPGIVVTLTDAADSSNKKYRLQDEDLWRLLNELLAAGAEGLAVGGERITGITGIRNVGQRIMVGRNMVAAPMEVLAIGDPKVLSAALKLRGGVIELFDRFGIKVAIREAEDVRIPAVRTVPTFLYARPTSKP